MSTAIPAHVRAGTTLEVDVVVIGAGVAGLVTALDLLDMRPETTIAVLDKGVLGTTGSTPLAQGGMAAAIGPQDSPALHAEDTRRAGDGHCDDRAVAVVAAEAPRRVTDLVRRGARFDRDAEGALHLAREGAQRVARCVHAADATGAEIFRALRTAATDRVTRLQGIASTLVLDRDPVGSSRVAGVWALLDETDASPVGPGQDAGLVCLLAEAVVIATGGCGGLYDSTTNRPGATADGVALAWQAGAALVDLEFIQFHPTALATDPQAGGASRLLLTEALRGAGAVLRDADGRRFMPSLHPDAELAPRHVVTKAILDQPGGAWLDATALGPTRLAEEFPTVMAGARSFGVDLSAAPVPVVPAQHYLIGGIATDLDAATSLPGLHAVGEAACTGVHGANRVAGNSLSQSCVFGHRAAKALAASLRSPRISLEPEPPAFEPESRDTDVVREELRRTMSAGAGAIRTADSLETAAKALTELTNLIGSRPQASRDSIELHHGLSVARLIVRSAGLREESRGVHWRDDTPGPSPTWAGVRLRVVRAALA